MLTILLSMLIAFIGYSIRYISSACQKIGLKVRETKKVKGSAIWAIATLCSSVSVFVVLYAVAIGSVSIVATMAGTGLVSLAVFSALVMKESIRKRELLGILLILGAAALIGSFIRESKTSVIFLHALFLVLAILLVVYTLLLVVLRNQKKILGILIGVFAGTISGFVPIFQKVATGPLGRASSLIQTPGGVRPSGVQDLNVIDHAKEVFLNPYALLWIVLSVGSMVIMQFAYKHDRAIRIIPAFSANYILIPVLLGVLCFRETLHPFQWIGVLFIFIGVLLITMPRMIVHKKAPNKV